MNSLTLIYSLNFFFPLQLSTPSATVTSDRFPKCSNEQWGKAVEDKKKTSDFPNECVELEVERSMGNLWK